jgi:hypothetical protein
MTKLQAARHGKASSGASRSGWTEESEVRPGQQSFTALQATYMMPFLSGVERRRPGRRRQAPGGASALRTERRRRIEDPAVTYLPGLATAGSQAS